MCYILTLIPSSLRYCFKSLIRISPKWKTLAAKAAPAFPLENVSRKCSIFPAPPEAITGICNVSAKVARASFAYPSFTPSCVILVKRISPAPRLSASEAH